MNRSIALTAADVTRWYVTPSYVAELYGVSRLKVYRAIKSGRINAVRVRGGTLVIDSRLLPATWPNSPQGLKEGHGS